MNVDIQEVVAQVDDVVDQQLRQSPRVANDPDPIKLARTIRQVARRASWMEERLKA
ncbi:MAG: hypothetical protein AAGF56_01630 [Pseudomonadota bacterium]